MPGASGGKGALSRYRWIEYMQRLGHMEHLQAVACCMYAEDGRALSASHELYLHISRASEFNISLGI